MRLTKHYPIWGCASLALVVSALVWHVTNLVHRNDRSQSDISNLVLHITSSGSSLSKKIEEANTAISSGFQVRNALDFSFLLKDMGAESISLNMNTTVGNDQSQTVSLNAEFVMPIDQLHELLLALYSSDPIVRVRRFRVHATELLDDQVGLSYPARQVFLEAEIVPVLPSRGGR